MSVYLVSFLIGVTIGLRTLAPVAVVSWATNIGWLHLKNTWLGFLGSTFTPYILSVLAILELIADKVPRTPSRKIPMQFGARIAMGALCGAALGAQTQAWIAGLIAGVGGAVVGTLGGAALRARLAQGFGKDLPVALLEDAVAIVGAILVVSRFS